jgi:mannose-6-phosphate isomerase-like protein (cupin superfamily)
VDGRDRRALGEHHRKRAHQFAQRDGPARGQRVRDGQQRPRERLRADGRRADRRRVVVHRRADREAHVDPVGEQRLGVRGPRQRRQLDGDHREPLAEAGERPERRHRAPAEVGRGHAEPPRLPRRGGPRRRRPRLGTGQRGPRVRQERLAGRGEAHAARVPLEQHRAHLALEVLQLPRQRRLRHAQPLGRAPHVRQLGDGGEVAEVAELHAQQRSARVREKARRASQRSVGRRRRAAVRMGRPPAPRAAHARLPVADPTMPTATAPTPPRVPAPATAFLRAPGSPGRIAHVGVGVHVLVRAGDTGGAWALVDYELPPGFAGPPPHRHAHTTEAFHCTAGRLALTLDGRPVTLGPGEVAVVPPAWSTPSPTRTTRRRAC